MERQWSQRGFDVLIDTAFDASRSGLRDVEVAEEFLETVPIQCVDDVLLAESLLPIHVQVRQVDDAHEDVHGDGELRGEAETEAIVAAVEGE